MSTKNWIGFALVPVLWTLGCAGMNNTESGAVTGGVLGAVAGTIVGCAARAPGAGALIGAGTGALVGAAAGNAQDKKEARIDAARRNVLRPEDVVYMVQSNVSDSVIINQIRTTGAIYQLQASDIAWLKSQGVSDSIVSEMQATAVRYPRRMYGPDTVVIVDQPPPVVGVGIGVRGRF